MTEGRAVGRYELVRELGRGGTATVYLARQTDLNRVVALKELSALPVSDPSTARRFVRESRLAGSLNHPNIVTVHDFFEDHGTPYIAMEYLARGSLRPLVDAQLTFAEVAGVLDGMLAGLSHAHEHGIVHRDIKPENLMITADGRVKIADFGIAKVVDEALAGTMLTAKGTTIGTPTYMAPEQAMGQGIGPWTDLYAVGVIAFELLAGRPPFETSGTPMAILLRHVNEPPLTLSSLKPAVDARLSEWIERLLEKEPEKRQQSASTASLALEEIVLDRLGPRWRRTARLTAPGAAQPTPATLPMPDDGGWEDTPARHAPIPTAMPRRVAPERAAAPTRRAAPERAALPRRDGRTARRVARALLFVTAFIVAVAAAIATQSGGDSADSGADRAVPAAAPAATSAPARGSRAGAGSAW